MIIALTLAAVALFLGLRFSNRRECNRKKRNYYDTDRHDKDCKEGP